MKSNWNLSLSEQVKIGQKLKDLRMANSMSMTKFSAALAESMGRPPFHKNTIYGWERGQLPPKQILMSICDYYGVTLDYFLSSDQQAELTVKNPIIWGKNTSPQRILMGECLKCLRKRNNLTQTEFAKRFSRYIHSSSEYKKATISGWEKGLLPKKDILCSICDFYHIDYDYLSSGKVLENDTPTKGDAHLLDLMPYDGLPVWCKIKRGPHGLYTDGMWAIVDCLKKKLVFSADYVIDFDDINFPIQNSPDCFSFAPDAAATSKPLSIQNIKEAGQPLWIETLQGEYATRHRMRGWGRYYDTYDAMIMKNGMQFPLSEYGQLFLCYSGPM